MYVSIDVCMWVYMCTYNDTRSTWDVDSAIQPVCTCISLYLYECIYICMYTSIYDKYVCIQVCMYVYMYIYNKNVLPQTQKVLRKVCRHIYLCTYIHMYTCILAYMSVCMYTDDDTRSTWDVDSAIKCVYMLHLNVCIYVRMYTCTYVCIHVYVYIHAHVCMCVHMYVCMYICTCITIP